MKIAILTGAGISAESGLGTFRDTDGLWSQYDLEDVATPAGFVRNPDLVHAFYNARRANCIGAKPNTAHLALSKLERCKLHHVTLITQNIDDLHQRAGSKNVIQMHGALMRALCADCAARWDAPEQMASMDLCPHCGAPATRPDVVWFGETPYHMEQIVAAVANSDLFVAIGTSAEVYPAAGLIDLAPKDTLEINLAPSIRSDVFTKRRHGPATQVIPEWVDELC